ncbi:MAG: ABC transporter permease, partial [Alloacidobacterium sp.]
TIVGLAVPLAIHVFSDLELQFSWISAVVALFVSAAIGIAFGTTPATRAAQLDPVECLKSEF